ncbi:cysteine synthase A [Vagococcus lutrae]|uniref:cysteine synthase A n=1 Tax=Vagococcus lutrae TaxID=81947 RepID=UPI002096D6FC|nr:cysteine synthase A [Vagococcus lutrae]MCO7150644.1 cysteine synthase A [Vagococcus lutrae]MDT2818501.1 cysteine synthase A [Vagococcus lutrae]MDT2843435.1 cysteine synthase A [Vagococcus lutrae]WCG05239.1 cysteine synthase A [Vagococcus lutrae]
MKKVTSVTELIGHTPIVKLNRVVGDDSADVFVKLEFFNPGGSVKDRIALAMVEEAERRGLLKPGYTIVEPTSGNTGIGLSMVAAAKGYKIVIVMPDTMSKERQQLMKAYGAELILTPGAEGMKGSIAKAEEIAAQENYFMPLQFDNLANPSIHERTTAHEILEAMPAKEIDAFVAGVGTGGTITGVSHILKQENSEMAVYAVEPAESEILRGGAHQPHKIQGIGAGFVPKVLDTDSYDKVLPISSERAIEMTKQVARKEGLLLGISSGAAIAAALDVAKELGKGHQVVVLAPDNGERYLSTGIFDA